ncbi:hypothetical protein EVAR_85802_1 [Eumeta japonica]|uniref:Uncharacterized protein n=1 Tax=Eumeta variegata TaxID=151549 RepID=A0A4C1UQ63_EUMVA|nr:hypothetical protein EVAR_85802_1 [Eumeta japonica]
MATKNRRLTILSMLWMFIRSRRPEKGRKRVKERHFYVWGRVKKLVYATEVQNVDLRERIEAAFQKIQQEMLLSTSTVETRRRCRACIANGGESRELPQRSAYEACNRRSTTYETQPVGFVSEYNVILPDPSSFSPAFQCNAIATLS